MAKQLSLVATRLNANGYTVHIITATLRGELVIVIVLTTAVGQIDMGNIRLSFWDLGGQEELQSLWDKVSPFLPSHMTQYLSVLCKYMEEK